MKYFILLSIALGACCRQKECAVIIQEPRIHFQVSKDPAKGFTEEQIRGMQVKIIGRSFHFLDSVRPLYYWDASWHKESIPRFEIDHVLLNTVGQKEIRDFDFLIEFDSSARFTVDSISYHRESETVECKGCSGSTYETSRWIKEFRYSFDKQIFIKDNVVYSDTAHLLEK